MRPDRNRERPRAPLRGEKRIFPAPAAEGPPPEDRDARTAYFDQARYRAEYLGVATDEGEFVVSTSDRHLGKALFVKRSRPEFRVLRLATSVVRSALGVDALAGRTFVDVGANIGTTTVCALRSHGFGAAVCCEAEPANHRLLEANLALNGLKDRAQTRRVGVSSHCGRAQLVVHEESGVFSWVAVDGAASYALAVVTTEDEPLWAWQGAETEVILGGWSTPPPAEAFGPLLLGDANWFVVAFDAAGQPIANSVIRPVAP